MLVFRRRGRRRGVFFDPAFLVLRRVLEIVE